MPNTLAHLGIQTLVTRAVLRDADVKWIWMGCVIPDLPWIAHRVMRMIVPDSAFLDVRLYAIAQASLLLCLVLSAALACMSDRPRRVFVILAASCVLHLVLDALQTKWANGVHLFAPVSWDMWNAGLFWPEDWPSLVLTLLGLAVATYAMLRMPASGDDLVRPRGLRLWSFACLCGLWLAGPLALMEGVRAADSHFVDTVAQFDARSGKPIEFDRNNVVETAQGPVLQIWTGEQLALTGDAPESPGKYSVKGSFFDRTTLEITASHVHSAGLREYATYLGLLLVLAIWIRCFWGMFRRGRGRAGREPGAP